MLNTKGAFSLLEILLVLMLLGVFGIFSSKLLLNIYQDYKHNNQDFSKQLEAQNTLLQIKRLLENAHFNSLQILPNTPISTTQTSLIGKSLLFYEKLETFAIQGDFAIPCFHGIFDPKSLRITHNTLTLNFLQLSNDVPSHTDCNFNLPQNALIITQDFNAPQDFYHPNFQAKILALNTRSILLEVPPILRQQPQIPITPQLLFLNSPVRLHATDSITLEQNGQHFLLAENLSHLSISSHPLGLYMRLCLDTYCTSTIVVDL